MTDKQDAIVDMYQEVARFFAEKTKQSSEDTILQNHVRDFNLVVKNIALYNQAQEFDSKGYATNKKQKKNELADLIFKLTSAFCSFANDTKNNAILEEYNKSLSIVQRLKDAEFVNYANQLAISLGENIKEITPYHITVDDVTNLSNETTNYINLMHIPDEVIKNKSVATDKIKELISDGRDILENSIDRDMVYYKDKNEDWYNEYLKRREIHDAQTTALSIKGTITGGDAEVEIITYINVTVKFKAGTDWKEMQTTSTALGNYQFKGIPDGKCTITFEKNYYETITIESEVHHQKATQLNVVMKKTK
jgi:hypothetical protein